MNVPHYSIRLFSNDEKFCVTSFKSEIQVWNLLEKRQEAVLEGHTSGVSSVAITSDNRLVVSGSGLRDFSDGTVRVWNSLNQNMVIRNNDIFIPIPSKLENKVYLSTAYGFSTLNLDEKKINHEFFFDKKLEELFNDNYCCEEDLLPKIA
ncbi:hypothetical protein SteCoe_39974 [Stentor coeruleus]|uniref:Uncharacterized protein n=1 Tax=Stentor coeruleus TaxID=5963 RepID=A0A1R2AKE5_9CILI|nr:hypothetical protein SteCoe_39974 [Stentor coeruleus]